MKIDDFEIFFKEVSEYYRRPLTDSILEAYWEDLMNFSIDEVRNAYKLHRQQSGYFPYVSDFIKNIERPEKMKKIIYCQHNENGTLCANEAKHTHIDHKLFCEEHFENSRSKSDFQLQLDDHAREIEEKAKSLGMSNEEYFRKCFPGIFKKTENNDEAQRFVSNKSSVNSYSNAVHLMTKLAGK